MAYQSKKISTKSKVPSVVDNKKVLNWTFSTPENEGVISIFQVYFEAKERNYNWLLFYCWCYVRTKAFRDPCMKRWDYGNLGGNFATSREGVQDALSEFVKHDNTEMFSECEAIESLYDQIIAWCEGEVWDSPEVPPLPEKPKPEPEKPAPEKPKPEPEPSPKPSEPSKPSTGFNFAKLILPLLVVLLSIASYFVPGWAKVAIDALIKILGGI